MSEQDFFKKLWSSVAISILTIVLTAVITMLLSYQAQSERINNTERGIIDLKEDMKTKVPRGEYEGIIQMLNEQDKELSQKIDKNQEVIVKFLFDIKNEIK